MTNRDVHLERIAEKVRAGHRLDLLELSCCKQPDHLAHDLDGAIRELFLIHVFRPGEYITRL